MKILSELKYSRNHEWVKTKGNRAYIGITDYAQHALGSIVFTELPRPGTRLSAGDVLGVVESVKAASDIYSPVSGRVVEINEALTDAPGRINEEPYESWIAAVELASATEMENLMDAASYEKFCKEGD